MRTVARLTNVEPHRIRFWEQRYRLISPVRDGSGRRLFSKEEIERIRTIGRLVDSHGMSLTAIGNLLQDEST